MQPAESNNARNSATGIVSRGGANRAARHALLLRSQFGKVADRSLSVDDFRQWFINSQWLLSIEGDDATNDLVNVLEGRFAELTSGYIDDVQFISLLAPEFDTLVAVSEVTSSKA